MSLTNKLEGLAPALAFFINQKVLIALSFTATELMEAKKSRFTEFTMGSFTFSDIEELNVIDRSFAGKWDILKTKFVICK